MKKPNKDCNRKMAKEIRSSLNITKLSQAIVENIKDWNIYQNAQHVLTYSAFGHEFDLSELESDNKKFYLTRTLVPSNLGLSIHKANSPLERHSYGYLQPIEGLPKIDPKIIDLVLVPGLAFDEFGNRLGYGKGYYDRLLVNMAQSCFLGVCARAQVFKNLPSTDFDIAMHYIVNEKEIIKA